MITLIPMEPFSLFTVYLLKLKKKTKQTNIKDGAYYCYCILRIARYSGFLWVVPTNTGIFARGLKLYRESRTYQMLLVPQKKKKKKLGVTMHFSEIIKLQFRKKSHTLLYIFAFFRDINVYLSLKNAWLPQFSLWITIALAKICFPPIVINRTKYFGISRHHP